ncbi:MAG: hypothetical protein WBD40_10260, partial [Tepidisphaeraceae bacterium]
MSRRASLAALSLASIVFVSADTQGGPVADFDDGNQGFTAPAPGFSLDHQASGGNPDGFALLSDLAKDGAGGFVHAPDPFVGDLSGFESVQWDILRPSDAILPGIVLVEGPGGRFVFASDGASAGDWETITAPFDDAGAWEQADGSGTLADTLGGVTRLGFLLEVTATTGTEAGLDNVRLLDRDGNGNGGGQVIPLPA